LEKDIRTVDPAGPGIEDGAVTMLRDGCTRENASIRSRVRRYSAKNQDRFWRSPGHLVNEYRGFFQLEGVGA